tara:strand:+ start:255 stop:701 length:447 start_codon:yes stop_codon:yes gene_type:complete
MNWGVCKSGSNNIHFDFPPIMHDGRNYSSWLPGGQLNEEIKKTYNITSNNDYRKYLTKNADSIIKYNQLLACDECCSNVNNINNYDANNNNNNTPFLYNSCFDTTKPQGYENSDLKEIYLSKFHLQGRLVTPVLSQEQLLLNGFPNYN